MTRRNGILMVPRKVIVRRSRGREPTTPPVPASSGRRLESMTVPELRKLAISKGLLEPPEGTGAGGGILKADWINLLRSQDD